MTSHRLTLQRATVIPPDIEVGIVMRRTVEPGVSAGVVPEVAPAVSLPAGSDVWYDSPNNSVSPFGQMSLVTCADTDATDFTIDDAVDNEADLPPLPPADAVLASAWWQVTVPDTVAGALLTIDTWQTRGGLLNEAGDAPATYPTDTNMSVYAAPDPPPLDPLPSATVDFSKLVLVAQTDDTPQPPGVDFPYLSWLFAELEPNKVYFIRVDTWGGEAAAGSKYFDGIIYRLRVSIAFF